MDTYTWVAFAAPGAEAPLLQSHLQQKRSDAPSLGSRCYINAKVSMNQVSFILLARGNERGESTAVGRGFQTFKQKSYKFDFYKGCKHKFGSSYSSLASKRIMEAK